MSTSSGPNSSAESNLVFAFDMADTKNSFKGEPATNIWESGDPNGHGSILEKIYTNKFLNKTIDSGVVYHNIVNRKATTDSPDKTFFNNGGLNMGSMNFQTLRSDTRYIQISFDYYGVKPYQRFCCPHLGLNGYLGISYTDGTTNTSGWDTTYSPGDSDDWNNLEENMGKWQRISLIATVHPDRVPQGIWAFYIYYDSLMYGQGYFTNMIFTEHASYPTGPVRYTSPNETRDAYSAIKDLTKRTSIGANFVNFNSEGKILFDGTGTNNNLYVDQNNDDHLKLYGDHTIEAVINPYSDGWVDSTASIIRFGMGADLLYAFQVANRNQLVYHWVDTGFRSVYSPGNIVNENEYNHVLVIKSGLSVTFYSNGVYAGEYAITQSTVNPGSIGIGATRHASAPGTTGQDFSGEIPVLKIYNKALTAEEVQKNFKVIQKRFNIE